MKSWLSHLKKTISETVRIDDVIHQSQPAETESRNLQLADGLAKVISGQFFGKVIFSVRVICLIRFKIVASLLNAF